LNSHPDLSQPVNYGFSYDASSRQFTWSDLQNGDDAACAIDVDEYDKMIPSNPDVFLKCSIHDQNEQVLQAREQIFNAIRKK
jgi:hypothetical protein